MAALDYLIHLAILFCIYAILTISFNFTIGFAGLLNLGHIAFFGIGAYVSALLILKANFPIVAAIALAAAVPAIFGLLLAIPTMRLKGDYLALATLAFTFIVQSVARNWIELTRGALGIPGIPKLLPTNAQILLFLIVLLCLSYALLQLAVNSKFGKTIQAIRDDELAAAALGKNIFVHKTAAFVLGGLFAGLAGASLGHYLTFVDPSIFNLEELIALLSMLFVGGLASLPGSIVGAALLIALPEPLRFIGIPSATVGALRAAIFAIALLCILLARPKGLFGKIDLG